MSLVRCVSAGPGLFCASLPPLDTTTGPTLQGCLIVAKEAFRHGLLRALLNARFGPPLLLGMTWSIWIFLVSRPHLAKSKMLINLEHGLVDFEYFRFEFIAAQFSCETNRCSLQGEPNSPAAILRLHPEESADQNARLPGPFFQTGYANVFHSCGGDEISVGKRCRSRLIGKCSVPAFERNRVSPHVHRGLQSPAVVMHLMNATNGILIARTFPRKRRHGEAGTMKSLQCFGYFIFRNLIQIQQQILHSQSQHLLHHTSPSAVSQAHGVERTRKGRHARFWHCGFGGAKGSQNRSLLGSGYREALSQAWDPPRTRVTPYGNCPRWCDF